MPTDRIARLREAVLARNVTFSFRRAILEAESWRASSGEPWWIVRKGRKVRHVLQHLPVEIGDHELLVGRAALHEPTPEEHAALQSAGEFMATQPPVGGQTGHMTVDNEKLLALGIRGVQAEIRGHQQSLDLADPDDQQKDAFYRAALEALEGVCEFAARNAALAREMADAEPDPGRAAELREIAKVCDRVPAYPATTVREALQAYHTLCFCLSYGENIGLFCPGRIDRWLIDFYRADLAAGRTTPEQTQELIDCVYILINELVPASLAVGVMVGGQDAAGRDVTNEISYMCLQAVENTRLAYPTLGICYHAGTPEALMDKGCELLAAGRANPAIFNDDVIAAGLQRAGVAPEQSRSYINSTCVELSPIASSNIWVASPYFNTTGTLLGLLQDVVTDGGKAPTFDDLVAGWKTRISREIHEAVAEQNVARETRARFGGYPLLSCFVNDCLTRGTDIDHGGARHNWVECSFVGVANLVDSLSVIRRFVYEQQRFTLSEVHALARDDFAGSEDIRQQFLNDAPKYGNDDTVVDDLAVDITRFLTDECARHKVRLNDRFWPGMFCWIMHQILGSQTGASPDGRRAGFPFADGAGPAQGRELAGPTAAIKSTTKWDHTPMLGGLVLNLKFSPAAVRSPEGQQKMKQLLKTYMQLGGQEVQVNVVGLSDLQAARANPEAYRDLVVRIAGYCDYFVGLPPGMQEEIMMRTEYAET